MCTPDRRFAGVRHTVRGDRGIAPAESGAASGKMAVGFKKDPPPHLRKQILVPLLAYKLQEQAYVGLRPEIKRRLRELANSFESRPKWRFQG